LERRGQVKVVHVAVPAGLNHRGGTFLVATRSEMGLLDWPDGAALRTIATEGHHSSMKQTEGLEAGVGVRSTH
jgi:hypothetical protein